MVIQRILFAGLVAAAALYDGKAASQVVRTIHGNVVDVNSATRVLTLRVPLSTSGFFDTRVYIDALTRIRQADGVLELKGVRVGDPATVIMARVDGKNVARVIEVDDFRPPVSEAIVTVQDQAAYEAATGAMLDVLEEEIDELERSADAGDPSELGQRSEWGARLRAALAEARDRFARLRAARDKVAWRQARLDLEAALAELGELLAETTSEGREPGDL